MKKYFFILYFFYINLSISAQNKQGQESLPTPAAVTATMVSFGYMANTTHTLDISFGLTNSDLEFVDSLSITFPMGITPLSSPNTTFPSIDTSGGAEKYNGVNGQTISWGSNTNDAYGGITGSRLSFKVVVSVGAISGMQTASFFISGDGYFQWGPTGDYTGVLKIAPKLPVDLRVIEFFIPQYSCLNGTNDIIEIRMRNDGYQPATGGVNVTYQINADPPVNETYTLTINPDDTLKHIFATTANFSALGGYTVTGVGSNSLDGDNTNNSTERITFSYPKNSIPYTSGFEHNPPSDLLNWYGDDYESPHSWDTTNISPRTGSVCIRMLETTSTTCDDWLFSPCLDLQAGKTYKLEYWTRLTSNYAGSLGVYLAIQQNAYATVSTLKPVTALTANSIWMNNVSYFSAPSSGVYHIGFEAVNATPDIIALRLDDISVTEITAGMEDIAMENISVYPNPVSDVMNVFSTGSLVQMEIADVLGKVVFKGETSQLGENSFNVSDLTTGYYVAKFSNIKNVVYKNIIVKK